MRAPEFRNGFGAAQTISSATPNHQNNIKCSAKKISLGNMSTRYPIPYEQS